MTYPQALNYFQNELDTNSALNSTFKSKLSSAINDLNNSTVTNKIPALENLNDLYWDAPVLVQVTFGQALTVAADTVNPDAPYPKVRA